MGPCTERANAAGVGGVCPCTVRYNVPVNAVRHRQAQCAHAQREECAHALSGSVCVCQRSQAQCAHAQQEECAPAQQDPVR